MFTTSDFPSFLTSILAFRCMTRDDTSPLSLACNNNHNNNNLGVDPWLYSGGPRPGWTAAEVSLLVRVLRPSQQNEAIWSRKSQLFFCRQLSIIIRVTRPGRPISVANFQLCLFVHLCFVRGADQCWFKSVFPSKFGATVDHIMEFMMSEHFFYQWSSGRMRVWSWITGNLGSWVRILIETHVSSFIYFVDCHVLVDVWPSAFRKLGWMVTVFKYIFFCL